MGGGLWKEIGGSFRAAFKVAHRLAAVGAQDTLPGNSIKTSTLQA